MRLGGIGDREGCEMNATVALDGGLELGGERGLRGLEQDLDVAAPHHGTDVADAGRGAVGVDLNRDRRRRKAGTHKRAARRVPVRHEMADVVEKDLVATWELPVGFASVRHCSSCGPFSAVIHAHMRWSVAWLICMAFGLAPPDPIAISCESNMFHCVMRIA